MEMKKKIRNLIMSENNMQSCLIYLHVKQLTIEQQLKITNFLLCEGKSRREKEKI